MKKDLILQLENEFQKTVEDTIWQFEGYGLRVNVHLIENHIINAGVHKVPNTDQTYEIYINTGVIESLKEALDNVYLKAIDDEDFSHYQFESIDTLYRHYENSTAKNSFMDLLVRYISHNILFHECGHILLGHCDGRINEVCEQSSSNSNSGGYGLQSREMMADWYGTKIATSVLLFSFAHECGYRIHSINDIFTVRKILFLALLALYCQYNLFEATEHRIDEFSEQALKKRTHPHPYIRLLYGCDIVKETLMDVFEQINHINASQSEQLMNEIVMSVVDDLLTMLKKMGLSNLGIDSYKRELIECYISIRKKAASRKHSTNPYIKVEMQKMSKAYLESLRSIAHIE